MFNFKNKNSIENKFLLVGAPNVGKSTYFNKITWKVSSVANIDRYTTCLNSGSIRGDKKITILDLPGVSTFSVTGMDEEVAINNILDGNYKSAINIISLLTIKRDLYLSLLLAEANVLNNIVINMCDEIKDSKIKIHKLESKFNVPVSLISAKKNINIKNSLNSVILDNPKPHKDFIIAYDIKIEKIIEKFAKNIPENKISPRFLIIEALNNNNTIIEKFKEWKICDKFDELKLKMKFTNKESETIENTRKKWVTDLLLKALVPVGNQEGKKYYSKFKKIDNILMNPWIAIPGFLLLMIFIYFLTFYEYAGGYIQAQFADNGLGALQTIISDAIVNINPDSSLQLWLSSFVGDGIIGGVFTIIGFLPWVIILFISISMIEQIGILSRLSIVFDNLLKKSGLSGRALINLFTGVGCNIPSMLLSRGISNRKEQIISIMVASLVSCSARVIVYGFISDALIHSTYGWMLSFGITMFSIIVALFVAKVFSKTLFRKNNSLFLTQIPRWRSLDLFVIVKQTAIQVYSFVSRTIIIVTILNLVVWILISTGPNSQFYLNLDDPGYINNSFLYYLSYPIRYLLYPIGLGYDFRFSVVLLASFPAKEVAASTIETLYGSAEAFQQVLYSQKYAIPALISFLTIFTFYLPCVASVVVMKKEIGIKYTLISIFSTLIGTLFFAWLLFLFSSSIEYLLIPNVYQSVVITLLVIAILIVVIVVIVYALRVSLQNKGIQELPKSNYLYKKISYVSGVSLVAALIGINTLLLI